MKNWNRAAKQEFKRIRNIKLIDVSSPWIEDLRQSDNRIWENDNIMRLRGMGHVTRERILEVDANMKTIKALITSTNAHLKSIKDVSKFFHLAKDALPDSCPNPVIDHRLADNPYQSRYGTNW